jgi:hypothetical protein
MEELGWAGGGEEEEVAGNNEELGEGIYACAIGAGVEACCQLVDVLLTAHRSTR